MGLVVEDERIGEYFYFVHLLVSFGRRLSKGRPVWLVRTTCFAKHNEQHVLQY